jgi:hypothetical protein
MYGSYRDDVDDRTASLALAGLTMSVRVPSGFLIRYMLGQIGSGTMRASISELPILTADEIDGLSVTESTNRH